MVAVLVGSVTVTSIATSYDVTLYNNLTGGESNSPLNGDYVYVLTGFSAISDGNPGITASSGTSSSGLFTGTEIIELFQNSTHDTNLSVSYFIYDDTRHRTITVTGTGSTSRAAGTIVAVFRGIHTELASTGFSGSDPYLKYENLGGTGIVATAPIVNSGTTSNKYIWLSGVFASAGANLTPFIYSFTPTSDATINGYKGVISSFSQPNSTSSISMAVAWGLIDGSGTPGFSYGFTPGTWTNNSTTGTGASWVAFNTYAPQGGGIYARVGSTWKRVPVKVWNGTNWITRKVRTYTGAPIIPWPMTPL